MSRGSHPVLEFESNVYQGIGSLFAGREAVGGDTFFEGTEASQAQPVYWHEYSEKPVNYHRMGGWPWDMEMHLGADVFLFAFLIDD